MEASMRIKIIVATALVLLVICLAFLPTLLSTGWAQGKMQQYVNEKIPGQITFREATFSWLGPQQIKEVSLLAPDQSTVLKADAISLNISLISWLSSSQPLEGSFNNLCAHLHATQEGCTNFEDALGIPAQGRSIANQLSHPLHLVDASGRLTLINSKKLGSLSFSGGTQYGEERA